MSSREPTVPKALDFMQQVKSEFQDTPWVYNRFVEIMNQFKNHQIDIDRIIDEVKELFLGHNSLLVEFNQFLPPAYHINPEELPDPPQAFTIPNYDKMSQFKPEDFF